MFSLSFFLGLMFLVEPRRSRQSSVEKASAKSESCDQLSTSNSTSITNSPVKTLYSLPERLSECCDNLETINIQENLEDKKCPVCDHPMNSYEHAQMSLSAPLDATTQTKRKKNFMDRCVNKVRLC
ncbi:unnamed protein product [Euphydryas editha]|uniref:Uncharacterized protein n=1 Tax=Euphydryas editha TaxID=104508 RepID=A0AAU9TLL6_EUPED|nr:unnamed protein product [Euphydryas editha]